VPGAVRRRLRELRAKRDQSQPDSEVDDDKEKAA
jgi:hypothetical protein